MNLINILEKNKKNSKFQKSKICKNFFFFNFEINLANFPEKSFKFLSLKSQKFVRK